MTRLPRLPRAGRVTAPAKPAATMTGTVVIDRPAVGAVAAEAEPAGAGGASAGGTSAGAAGAGGPAPRAAAAPVGATALRRGTPGRAARRAGASVGRRVSRHRAVLPAVLTVLLLAVPVGAFEAAGGRLVAADIASLLLVAAGIVAVVRGRRRALGVPGAAVFAAAVLALGVVHLTSTGHPDALLGWVRYLQVFVLVPLAVVVLVRDRRDARAVGAGFLVLALAQGTLGILQYATGTGASYMGEDIRAVGTFGPQNVMGMSTVVCFGLLVAVCGALAPPPGAPRWWRPAAVGCAGWLLLALAVSFSRGAWIAAAVACAAVVLLSGALTRRAVTALCVLVVLAGGTAVTLSGRLADRLTSIGQVTGTPDQSVVDRYAMWDAARSMWRQEPWTGVGLKGFPAHRDAHASVALSAGSDTAGAGAEFQRQALESPHNMYLLVLGEQGLVGATALIGGWAVLLAGCLLRVRAARRLASGAPDGGTGRGLFGGVGPLGVLTARPGVPDVGLLATGLMIWLAVTFAFADIGGPTTVATAVVLGLVAWWAVGTPSPATAAPAVGAAPGDAGADTAPNRADGDAPETGTPAARPDGAAEPVPARPDADGVAAAAAEADGAAGNGPGDDASAAPQDDPDGRAEDVADVPVAEPEAAAADATESDATDREPTDREPTDREPTDGAAVPDTAVPDGRAAPEAAGDDCAPEAGSGTPGGPAARVQREAP